MSDDHRVQHPLGRRAFYAECFRYATTGAWGVIGDLGTAFPLIALSLKHFAPRAYAVSARFMESRGFDSDWLLLGPAAVGALILIGRLVTAPFILYRDKPSATYPKHAERGRRLNEDQKATVISSLSADVAALLSSFTDSSREELAKHTFPVRVVALGNDQETLAYRKQFVSVIEAAGNFKVFTEEWNPGPEEYESFLDGVTLLRPFDEQNRVRPMFLKALRSAGIEVREAGEPPVHGTKRSTKSDAMESVRLVIGQRR